MRYFLFSSLILFNFFLSASMGLSIAAFRAGYTPNRMPIPEENSVATRMVDALIPGRKSQRRYGADRIGQQHTDQDTDHTADTGNNSRFRKELDHDRGGSGSQGIF